MSRGTRDGNDLGEVGHGKLPGVVVHKRGAKKPKVIDIASQLTKPDHFILLL